MSALDILTKNYPSGGDSWLKEFSDALTDEQFYKLYAPVYGQIVRDTGVSIKGFCAWYELKFQRPTPPVVKYVWAKEFVKAFNEHTGVLLEGHRGSGKSTFLITWVEYLIGKRPVGSSQLIRINSQQAGEADEAISATIEFSEAWKLCFPNVVPDKDKGWSVSGRFVKDLSVCGEDNSNYGEWIQQTTADHLAEPSFLCSGITSRDFIGKHPSNGQYFDDLHDEGNTRSAREMQEVVDLIEKNIVPTWTRPENRPVLGVACTLWNANDGYHALLRTGLFKHVRTPICVPVARPVILSGNEEVVCKWVLKYEKFMMDGVEYYPMWDKYPGATILQIKTQQPVYFGIMYMCDLESLKGKVLKGEWLHVWPLEKIMPSWPVYFGIDFATVEDKLKDNKRDYFALAVLAVIPWGGAVIIDGFREHLEFFEAVERVKSFAIKYPTLVTVGVEKWGSGEKFKEALLYNSKLNVLPFPFAGAPVYSKGQRYQLELAPMFVDGRLWVSDAPVAFIEQFTNEWITWDGGKTATGHDDCLDAVYTACGVAQGHLMPKPPTETVGQFINRKVGLGSPWSSLGKS